MFDSIAPMRIGALCANLALVVAGGGLLAAAFGWIPGVEVPFVRALLIVGWLLAVVGLLRLSAEIPPRRAAHADVDPRARLIA